MAGYFKEFVGQPYGKRDGMVLGTRQAISFLAVFLRFT
jgi:hypothetical protein